MAEKVFRAAGVQTSEIDLTGRSLAESITIEAGAGVIGTSQRGPAFVPVTVDSYSRFEGIFGNLRRESLYGDLDDKKYGPVAVNAWLSGLGGTSQVGATFIRLLGVGNGLKRNTNGTVTNAGFVVGDNQVRQNGTLGANPFANANGEAGRLYFLGCFMSESAGSTYLTDAGIQKPDQKASKTLTVGSLNLVNGDKIIIEDPSGNVLELTAADAENFDHAYDTGDFSAVADNASGQGYKISGNFHTNNLAATPANLVTSIVAAINAASTLALDYTAVTAKNKVSTGFHVRASADGANLILASRYPGKVGEQAQVKVKDVGGATISGDFGIADDTFLPLLNGAGGAVPIIRAIIMAASGVHMTLSASYGASDPTTGLNDNSAVGSSDSAYRSNVVGFQTGTLSRGTDSSGNTFQDRVTLYLNGHKQEVQAEGLTSTQNVIAFDLGGDSPNYLAGLNFDPQKLEQHGHVVYAHYPVAPQIAHATGSGQFNPAINVDNDVGRGESIAFLLTGSTARNTFAADVGPNYENFEDRYTTPATPYITSQFFGGTSYNLFRFISVDDGDYAAKKYKIQIGDMNPDPLGGYGKFSVTVRDFTNSDSDPRELQKFVCSLDPNSNDYIAKVIGDRNISFNFDKSKKSQKLEERGEYPVTNQYIRVEMNELVRDGEVPKSSMPFGHRGYYHLVTSGSACLKFARPAAERSSLTNEKPDFIVSDELYLSAQTPPIPYRRTVQTHVDGATSTPRTTGQRCWGAYFGKPELYDGTQFDSDISSAVDAITEEVGDGSVRRFNLIQNFAKHFPKHAKIGQPAWVGANEGTAFDSKYGNLDADTFQRGQFSLNHLKIFTGSRDANNRVIPPSERWARAEYVRGGGIAATGGATMTRGLEVADFQNRTWQAGNYLKYCVFMQGGFNGANIFDAEKYNMTNTAAHRELQESAQGKQNGSTAAAYLKALDIMSEKSDADIKLLAIPGISVPHITDAALTKTEERFDALYLMDIEVIDSDGLVMTGSQNYETAHLANTISQFKNRSKDSSFGAAYFPPVRIEAPLEGEELSDSPSNPVVFNLPASAAALGAFGSNDRLAHPWFAPAGFARGALAGLGVTGLSIQITDNQDTDEPGDLYTRRINPIVNYQNSQGVVVWGQKTLLVKQNSLDRVNVRRLLIEIRRRVRAVADRIIFEPNRETTLARFSGLVKPILKNVQETQGVRNFRVLIDSSTTTQADIENNTVRGQIYIQPTRSIEFISLDFVLTNAGAEI